MFKYQVIKYNKVIAQTLAKFFDEVSKKLI